MKLFKDFWQKSIAGVFLLTILAGVALVSSPVHATFYPVEGSTYTVSEAVLSGTQNYMYLSSFDGIDGTPLTMSEFGYIGYATVDPNNLSRTESISFTGITQFTNGTAELTGVNRGLSFVSPYAASSTLARVHLVGAQVVLANSSAFYGNEFALVNGNNVNSWPTASTSLASKGYVDYVGSGGANVIPATFTAQGVSQLATGAQAAVSTVTGSTGFNLVIPSSIATSTNGMSGNHVVVTGSTGYMDPSFINNLATSTTLGGAYPVGFTRQIFTNVGTSTWSVPTGVTVVNVLACGGGAAGSGAIQASNVAGGSGGSSGGCADGNVNVSATTSVQFYIGQGGIASSTTATSSEWTSFGTNCYFLCGLPGNTVSTTSAGNSGLPSIGAIGGLGLKGDYNIQGAPGGIGFYLNATSIDSVSITSLGISGFGGSSIFGGGAPSVTTGSGQNLNGVAAGGYSSGGSGALVQSGVTTNYGGPGSSGILIISY